MRSVYSTVSAVFLAGTIWLLGATEALASGFPSFDGDRETILSGRVKPTQTSVSGKATTLGDWKTVDGRLLASDADAPNNRFWLSAQGEGSFANGLLRVRFEPGKVLDAGVLFRITSPKSDTRELSGYELSLTQDTLRLQRWDRGFVLPAGEEVSAAKLGKRRAIEVVIYMLGPQIIATIYDGDTLKPIDSIALHETTHARGRVGIRLGKKNTGGGITLISAMDGSKPAPKRKGSGVHGHLKLYGIDRDPGTTPFGNTRFVLIPKAERSELPRGLTKSVQTTFTDEDGVDTSIVFTDAVGLERIERAGLTVLAADSNVPWKMFDAKYRKAKSKPPKPSGRGFDLDESYKNPKMVADLLKAYNAKYPDISTLVEVGRTHAGRTIWGIKISDNPGQDENEPSVLLNGGHHASELLAIEYALDSAAHLLESYGRDREATRWVDGLEIFVVPMVNPDGTHMFIEESRFAGRKNARDTNHDGFRDPFEGVDLNRNYPFGWGARGSSGVRTSKYYRGPHPGSEPETMAMMTLADEQRFAASISFHTIGTALFTPYIVDGAQHLDPDVPLSIAMEMVGATEELPNKRFYEVRPNGYAVAGSDQDWLLHEFGTIAYILEGTHHNPAMSVRTASVVATRPIWKSLLTHVVSGPRISGEIRDAAGNPLVAEVRIEEITLPNKERWTTRARDGRFDRLLHGGGTFTVVASAPGYAEQRKTIRVRSKPTTVDLVLAPK